MDDNSIAGACYNYSLEKEIIINYNVWATLSDKQKQWLIKHEMGHCKDNLSHDNRLDNMGCPVSYMYWQIPNDKCL
jgi:hypothetical protein